MPPKLRKTGVLVTVCTYSETCGAKLDLTKTFVRCDGCRKKVRVNKRVHRAITQGEKPMSSDEETQEGQTETAKIFKKVASKKARQETHNLETSGAGTSTDNPVATRRNAPREAKGRSMQKRATEEHSSDDSSYTEKKMQPARREVVPREPVLVKATSAAVLVPCNKQAEHSAGDVLDHVLRLLKRWSESFEEAAAIGTAARLLVTRISEKRPANQAKLVAQFALAIFDRVKGHLDPLGVFTVETDHLFEVLAGHYGTNLIPSFAATVAKYFALPQPPVITVSPSMPYMPPEFHLRENTTFDTPERSPVAPVPSQITSRPELLPNFDERLPTEQPTLVQQPLGLDPDNEMSFACERSEVDFDLLLMN